jgi:pimeloyl-ACP methyl ester carboxylesterase
MQRVIVLPGMHGTTELLVDFAAAAPDDIQVELAALPQLELDYAALSAHFGRTLRLSRESVLVAESFSGPLAIMLARDFKVAGLVLCNTFAKAPYPSVLRYSPLSLLARIPPPATLVRYFVAGPDASDDLVRRIQRSVASVPPGVLASRARCALTVDVTSVLSECEMPILYLRGTEDRLVRDRSVTEILAGARSPITVARIRGPHLILTTSPHEVWKSISEFLVHQISR